MMITERLKSYLLAILAVAIVITLAPMPQTYGQSSFDRNSPEAAAIAISELESQRDTKALYKLLHPDAKKIVSEDMVAGWYRNEFFPLTPQPISEITSVQFVTWTWDVTGQNYKQTAEISFVQPFGTGSSQYLVNETVRLVQANGNWHWFFGRSSDFVEAQRALYDSGSDSNSSDKQVVRTNRNGSGSSNASSSNSAGSGIHPASTRNCSLVELAPGYPGYRGLVTGLSQAYGGLGDWDCVETLERDNPGFDKAEEDRQNLQAARSLGINGGPTDWLWENWMAIEAQRGLPTHCYSCLMFDQSIQPINTSLKQDWEDPRVLVGFMYRTDALELFLPNLQIRDDFEDNYQMRAYAFLVAGPSANANEIIQIYQQMGAGKYLGGGDASDHILRVGGYSWVTGRAYKEDQVFSVLIAFFASSSYLIPAARTATISQIDQASLSWRSELLTGSNETFVEFLRRTTNL